MILAQNHPQPLSGNRTKSKNEIHSCFFNFVKISEKNSKKTCISEKIKIFLPRFVKKLQNKEMYLFSNKIVKRSFTPPTYFSFKKGDKVFVINNGKRSFLPTIKVYYSFLINEE